MDPRKYYDSFSVTYDDRRSRGYHALIDELESGSIPSRSGLRILEAGCGTGLVLDRLRARGGQQLFGIDLSAGMLGRARSHEHAVAQASVTALPFPSETFDVAYSFKVLAHVPDIKGALAEMARVVRPGGWVIAEFYNRQSLRGLRWQAKKLFGGEKTAAAQRETQLFTRYDTPTEMATYLPPTLALESIRGVVIVTPAAVVLDVPLVGPLLSAAERRLTAGQLARFGGFAILVARRL